VFWVLGITKPKWWFGLVVASVSPIGKFWEISMVLILGVAVSSNV
jgi:hypothetical protein